MPTPASLLIVHPEGNVNDNPNLAGLVEILCERGYQVDLLLGRRPFPQVSPHPGARLLFLDEGPAATGELSVGDYRLVLGIDAEGIVLAAGLAARRGLPYGLVSYEIFFEAEVGAGAKAKERQACREAAFAVVQDPERAALLEAENGIPADRMVLIPVAGRRGQAAPRDMHLHRAFGLPAETRIMLFAGAVAPRAMLGELVDTMGAWPDGWVLLVHGRYGLSDPLVQPLIARHRAVAGGRANLLFSHTAFADPQGLSHLIREAHLGVALNRPTFADRWTGRNLAHLGLASGKFSTFLQHGIPVLVHGAGLMRDAVAAHGLGLALGELDELPSALEGFDPESCRTRCLAYFNRALDLDVTVRPLLEQIDTLAGR